MKKRIVVLLIGGFLFTLSCQFLFPTREGTIISACADLVSAVNDIQPSDIPQSLRETGIKTGGEFDANGYFGVLTHVSMQDGFVLDYVYPIPDLGASPRLYARPNGQPPYVSMDDIPENTELPDFRDHLRIENVEAGYFEYVLLDIMAGQFYLFWHSNYNDTEIVCDREAVGSIIEDVNAGDFGRKIDLAQQARARAMREVEPVVQFTGNSAAVEVIVFTKWGGFYRLTYTISRTFPHEIIDVKEENLVPYDCGVMF